MRKWRGICGESGCCLEKDHKGVCSFVAIEEHDYEVEAIVAQRRTRKGTEYLVKWLNWPTEDNTWRRRGARRMEAQPPKTLCSQRAHGHGAVCCCGGRHPCSCHRRSFN